MSYDMNIAVFASPFESGGVRLWYCPHNDVYRCAYEIVEGGAKRRAQFCVPAAMYDEVAAMIMDAMGIASTPLDRRS